MMVVVLVAVVVVMVIMSGLKYEWYFISFQRVLNSANQWSFNIFTLNKLTNGERDIHSPSLSLLLL